MLTTHLIFFGMWVVYYALHSYMALSSVKARVPLSAQAYRLLYSAFAGLGLLFILFFGASLESSFIIAPSETTTYVGLILAGTGVLLIKRAFRSYSFRGFIGFKKEDTTTLHTSGLQSRMRHPLYTGTILLVGGYLIFNPLLVNLVTFGSLMLYLPLGIRLEEKKLVEQFGQSYEKYRHQVPALFPNPFKKSSAS
ncbi:MAG: isoprenylcysteine carboxylmethyltransferase family protein [Roseivirga sp.]